MELEAFAWNAKRALDPGCGQPQYPFSLFERGVAHKHSTSSVFACQSWQIDCTRFHCCQDPDNPMPIVFDEHRDYKTLFNAFLMAADVILLAKFD